MSAIEPTSLQWRKSSHSNGQANCIEVATVQTGGTGVAVRDSKAADDRCLVFAAQTWIQLINNIESSVSR